MPIKVKLEDGTETDAYTPEELKARQESAIEEFKKNNPDKSEEINRLQSDLNKAREDLDKFKDKDLNFGELRKQKEVVESKYKDLAEQVDKKINAVKQDVLSAVNQDYYSETLQQLSGGDEELKKKIELHYKRLADPTATKEEINKKLRDAWFLATKPVSQDILNPAIISSANSGKVNINSNQSFSPDEKAIARKIASAGGMTLEDKDFK